MMVNVILTAMAAGCFVLFEIVKVKNKRRTIRWNNPFFTIGTVILSIAWIRIIAGSFNLGPYHKIRIIAGILLLVISLLLYVYILFFSLPHNTYSDSASDYQLMDSGIYGICRHPGFYGFLFWAISLAVVTGSKAGWITAAIYSMLNLGYIYLQDRYFFPSYLPGYDKYKKEVPFLAFWKKRTK